MRQVILASSSPRRKVLLEQIGLKCIVAPSNIEEKLNPRLKPRSQVELLAEEKANPIKHKYPDAILIAADTVIVFRDEILGKPASEEDAERILERLSGKDHQVITGFTIVDTSQNRSVTKSAVTTVTFKKLSKKEIHEYVKTGEGLDKAGGYGIQEKGAVLVEKIDGDYANVVGLPLSLLAEELKRFGVSIF